MGKRKKDLKDGELLVSKGYGEGESVVFLLKVELKLVAIITGSVVTVPLKLNLSCIALC